MSGNSNFTTALTFVTPFPTTATFILPTPAAITANVTVSPTGPPETYLVTLHPSLVVTSFTFLNNATSTVSPVTVPVPAETTGKTSSSSPAIPAALGAILGIAILAGIVIIALLLRKNRQLFRSAKQARQSVAVGEVGSSNYALSDKEVTSQEDSPEQLKWQLIQVRRELAAVTVLTPSTIRDQSDYVRDLTLLNDSIRQLSMRTNRGRPSASAAAIRAVLCAALWSNVFARFDAGLDGSTEQQLSWIMTQFKKSSTAMLWRAMTVQPLPLANPAIIANSVEHNLSGILGSAVKPGEAVQIVGLALGLSRALAEDGKGFAVSYVPDGQAFGLMSGTTPVPM